MTIQPEPFLITTPGFRMQADAGYKDRVPRASKNASAECEKESCRPKRD